MSARHMMATGRVKDGRTILRMVCSWCDKVIVHGDDDAPVSHGACPRCAREMVAEIAVRSLSELIDAVAVDGRHSPRAVRACRLTTQCIRDIVDVGASENGPDGGASQRADSDEAVPSGDDTSKVEEEAVHV